MTTLDQPLFSIAKKLQWLLEEFGINNFVFVLGSLHVEMAMLSTLGDWFQDSSWLELLSGAKVMGTGNQALLGGKEVSKTKYCHQVNAHVSNCLMKTAYEEAVRHGESADVDMESCRKNMEKIHLTFQHWSLCLRMEMALFMFTRSIRSRNFVLYKYATDDLLKWMVGLDHFHYAQW